MWHNSVSEENPEKRCHFDNVFQPSSPPLMGYHGNKKWPVFDFIISKDTLGNCLKSDTSLVNTSWTVFEIFRKTFGKGGGEAFCSPVQIGSKLESQTVQLLQTLQPLQPWYLWSLKVRFCNFCNLLQPSQPWYCFGPSKNFEPSRN